MGSGGGGGDGPPMDNNSPSGVTIRGGRMRASTPTSSIDRTTDRQLEEKVTTAGKTFGVMDVNQRRDMAIKQLEKRLANPQIRFGGIGTAVSNINLRNQIEALKAGGVANFNRSETGEYVAVGVTTESGGTLGREGQISGMTARGKEASSTIGQDEQPALTGTTGKAATDTSKPKESVDLGRAARRAAQSQKGAATRKFYSGVRPSGL